LTVGESGTHGHRGTTSSTLDTATSFGVDVPIERVEYDADAVAREVAASGLPAELADRFVDADTTGTPATDRSAPRLACQPRRQGTVRRMHRYVRPPSGR